MIYDNLKRRSDIDIALDNETRQIEKEINEDRIYERFFSVDKGDVVVDIGAHVGVFSQRALDLGASKVYALEPDPLFYSKLKQRKGVFANQVAIAATHGTSFITSTGHANTLSSDGENAVETLSLRELSLVVPKIDFLKIDCEGGEYDVFTEEYMKWIAENCKKIACEFHIHNDIHRGKIDKIFDLWDQYGIIYRITSLDGYSLSRHFNKHHFTEVLVYAVTPTSGVSLTSIGVEEKVTFHNVNGPYVQVNSNLPHRYKVKISDGNQELYSVDVSPNGGWARGFHQYYRPYHITVSNITTGKIVYDQDLDLTGKKVVIELSSKALGDTLAWVPYLEEFRKRRGCNLIAVTFHNDLFAEVYPSIEWMHPGYVIEGVYAWYRIGWFYNDKGEIDSYRNPVDPKGEPLQKTACDILGLPYREKRPRISYTLTGRPIDEPYICIATHATSQAKYWNHKGGWQNVVDYYTSIGYKVVLLSRETDGYMGNENPKNVIYPENYSLNNLINYLYYSEQFIGLGSGLSWLAWSLRTPTTIISGFSDPISEMQGCNRIAPKADKCHGCFNWVRLQHDGDWNWCPRHKGTPRQFECTSSITAEEVIAQLPF